MHAESSAILVTRPAGEASDRLCASLRGLGYRVVSQPLLELEPLTQVSPENQALIASLESCHHVICVSANAVRFGLLWLAKIWPELPSGPAWYAVGEATAALLEQEGVQVRTPGDNMTSEGLLALPGLKKVADQRALIIKGEGGRETLAETLRSRGAHVEVLACYRRSVPQLAQGQLEDLLMRESVGTVMISSGEGLANFRQLLRPSESSNFTRIRLIVPSARVAEMAQEAGFDKIATADNASDVAMCRALKECS